MFYLKTCCKPDPLGEDRFHSQESNISSEIYKSDLCVGIRY